MGGQSQVGTAQVVVTVPPQLKKSWQHAAIERDTTVTKMIVDGMQGALGNTKDIDVLRRFNELTRTHEALVREKAKLFSDKEYFKSMLRQTADLIGIKGDVTADLVVDGVKACTARVIEVNTELDRLRTELLAKEQVIANLGDAPTTAQQIVQSDELVEAKRTIDGLRRMVARAEEEREAEKRERQGWEDEVKKLKDERDLNIEKQVAKFVQKDNALRDQAAVIVELKAERDEALAKIEDVTTYKAERDAIKAQHQEIVEKLQPFLSALAKLDLDEINFFVLMAKEMSTEFSRLLPPE